MRNLKKVLSLALAMVMLLGMMVVGAGAATSFKDDSSIPEDRADAVAVANAIEVLLGDENGYFNPGATLTRAEAAVVLTKLDLGAEAAKALVPTDAASFDDVGTGYGWAKAYIDYCAGNGYMVGVGGNRFAPAQTLTSVEFGLMISRVLGYRDANEEITGDAWSVKAAALARKAGLGTDLAVGNNPMTRADMAQMVLNALTAPMVEYTGLNINTDQISVNSPASVRRHSANNSNVNTTYDGERIQSNITPIRLCEEKFPNLKLSRQDELDKFGRRCSVWLYKGLKIAGSEGTIVPDLAYNTKVTKDTVAEWAKMEDLYAARNINDQITMQLWINGKKMPVAPVVPDKDKPNETYAPGTDDWIGWYTGAGREVEVYLNKDNLREVERVVVVDTVLAEVTKVNPDETISVKLTDSSASERNVVLSTAIGYDEFKKGDMVLVQGYSTASDKLNAKTTVSSVIEAPVVVGFATVKGYDNQTDAAYITVDGKQYKDAYSVVKDFAIDNFELNTKFDSTLYLDTHDNIMKAIMGEDPNAVADKLIAVKRVYSALKDGEIVNMIEGVISNGNTVNWPVDGNYKAYENGLALWEKGTGRDSDKYKLTPVVDKATIGTVDGKKVDSHVANLYAKDATLEFKSNDVYGKGHANTYMYSDTVKFIFVDAEEGVTVVNGRQNHTFKADSDDTAVAYAVNQKGEIIAVFISDQADVANIGDIIYVHSRYREWDEVITRENGTRVQYYGYTAYTSDGVEIDHFLGEANDMANQFFVANKNSDGAYKKNSYSVIGKHTFVNGVVNTANGLTGDAFLLYEFGNTDATKDTATGTVFEFLGRSSAKVVDLTDSKLYIESISEINDAVNAGRKITLAVIYNSTTAPVVKGSADTETVKDPQTIFVIGVGAVGSLDDVDFTVPTGPVAGKLTIVDTDKGLVESKPADGADVKKDDTITVTVKEGFEAKAEGATRKAGETGNTYTFTADSDKGVTVTVSKAGTTGIVITFNDAQWFTSTNPATFYVNGKALTEADFTKGVGKSSFTVKATDEVTIVKASSNFTTAGKYYVNTAATVVGTVDPDVQAITFKAPASLTLKAPGNSAGQMCHSGNKVAENDANLIPTLKFVDGADTTKTIATGDAKVTATMIATDGGIQFDFNLPTGYTLFNNSSNKYNNVVSIVAKIGSSEYTLAALGADNYAETTGGFAISGNNVTVKTKGTTTDGTNMNAIAAALTAKTDVNVTLTVKLAAVTGKALTVESAADNATIVGGTVSAATVSTTTPAAVSFDLSLKDANGAALTGAKKVEVTYTLTNAQAANGSALATETKTVTDYSSDPTVTTSAIKATGDVTITVTKVEVKTVVRSAATLDSTLTTYAIKAPAAAGEAEVGKEIDIPDVVIKEKTTAIVSGSKATIKMTITGVKDGPVSITLPEVEAATDTTDIVYTVNKAKLTAAGQTTAITPDGSGPVTIKVTAAELTSVKAKTLATPKLTTNATDSTFELTIGGVTLNDATVKDIAVVNGKADVSVTVTKVNGNTLNGSYVLKVDGKTAGQVSVTDNDATVTFEVKGVTFSDQANNEITLDKES